MYVSPLEGDLNELMLRKDEYTEKREGKTRTGGPENASREVIYLEKHDAWIQFHGCRC